MTAYEGRNWRLVRGIATDPARPVTARFVDGTLSGSISDARYRAEYDAGPDDGLRIGPPSMSGTLDDGGFATLLRPVTAARVAGEHLELLDASGDPLLSFEAAPDVPEGLAGRWAIRSVTDDAGERTVQDAWIDIALDGTVTGDGGVNRIDGHARADGDRLYLGPLRTTRMAGADDAMRSEAAVLGALDEVARFRASGDALQLLDADDRVVLRLVRG